MREKRVFLLLAFLAAGLILRLNNLSGRSLWTDEFFTLFQSSGHGEGLKRTLDEISSQQDPPLLKALEFKAFLKFDPQKSVRDVTGSLFNTDTHPPLYFWIMYFWRSLFRDDIFAIRLFSVLMGLISIVLAYKVAFYLFNKDVAKFCALFVSLSGFCVRYSQEARAYSLVTVLGLLSWFFLLRLEKHNKYSDALSFAVINSLGFYTHYFFIFLSLAQFAYFTITYRKESPRLTRFYLGFLCSALFFSPWFIPLILKGYNFYLAEWIFGYPGLINKVQYLFSGISRYILVLDIPGILPGVLVSGGLLLFICLLSYALKDMSARYPRQAFFCLAMFLLPLLGMFVIDILQHGALLKQERFWVFPSLGFFPLAGYSLNIGFSKIKPAAYALILIMLLSCLLVSKIQFGPAPKYTSEWINRESGSKPSAVIIYNIRSAVIAQSYYLDDGIYLVPVSDARQLSGAIKKASGYADKIFIARHHHRSDSSLMDQPFMEIQDTALGFKFKGMINNSDIKISEYSK